MNPIRIAIPSAVILSLSGCAALQPDSETALYSRVPEGSVLRIEQRIPIPAGRARIWLRGDSLSTGSTSVAPICGLEVDEIDHEGVQYIEPGELRIRRVQNLWAEVVQRWPALPDGARLQLADVNGGGGTPMIREGWHLWLEGEQHPNLMRLTCVGMLNDMPEARPPTVAEIRASLGRFATLELADAR